MTFIGRPKPRSVAEAVSLDSHDRIVSIAKTALQSYIASFMDTTGINRHITETVSRQALQYVTDKSLGNSPDPLYKPTQLARMFNDIRQTTPAILIVDSGLEWIEPGLGGGFERASVKNGNWQGWYRIIADIPVVVAVVSQDVETTTFLQNILAIFFKQLRREAGGNRMYREGDTWEVRLPLNFSTTVGAATNVANDPRDQIWAATIELVLQAEDLFCVEKQIVTTQIDGGVVNDPNLAANYPPLIDVPETVKIQDGPFMAVISQMNDNHRIVISNPQVATIDTQAMIITPQRLGTFDLMVVDTTQRTNDAPAKWAYKTVASKTVTVGLV